MRNRARMIATAAAASAALAAGSAAAVASTTAATPRTPAKTMSARVTAGGSKAAGAKSAEERQGHAAIAAAVAQALRVSTARATAALRKSPPIGLLWNRPRHAADPAIPGTATARR